MAKKSKTTNDSEIVRANINRRVVAAANFASLYVNDTQVQVTPWDIRLLLGVISELPSPPENTAITITQIGEIRMSPPHAKKVAEVLARQIALYEKNFGIISMPQE